MKTSLIISGFMAANMSFLLIPELNTAFVAAPTADILINEVCTQNKACLIDSYGKFSDWIELFNASDKDISLGGYSISKDPEKPKTWVFLMMQSEISFMNLLCLLSAKMYPME